MNIIKAIMSFFKHMYSLCTPMNMEQQQEREQQHQYIRKLMKVASNNIERVL